MAPDHELKRRIEQRYETDADPIGAANDYAGMMTIGLCAVNAIGGGSKTGGGGLTN